MIANPTHPEGQQLQAYLDGALDDLTAREILEHLEISSTCREELVRFERLFSNLESLPELSFKKDLSASVIEQLQDSKKWSQGVTWTLVIEVLAAGGAIGLRIPAFQASFWINQVSILRLDVLTAINIFLIELASSWMVWWAQLQLNLTQIPTIFSIPGLFPSSLTSPWTLILAAGVLGLFANYLLLRHPNPLRKNNLQNH